MTLPLGVSWRSALRQKYVGNKGPLLYQLEHFCSLSWIPVKEPCVVDYPKDFPDILKFSLIRCCLQPPAGKTMWNSDFVCWIVHMCGRRQRQSDFIEWLCWQCCNPGELSAPFVMSLMVICRSAGRFLTKEGENQISYFWDVHWHGQKNISSVNIVYIVWVLHYIIGNELTAL